MEFTDQLLLKQVNGRTWWRGDMNRQSAIDHLTDLPVGSFVVRPSSQPGAVALSFKQEDGHIGHNTIVVEHEKNRIPPTTFRFSNASVQPSMLMMGASPYVPSVAQDGSEQDDDRRGRRGKGGRGGRRGRR